MSLLTQVWELLLFLLILAGPIPTCACFVLWSDKPDSKGRLVYSLLTIITSWLAIETSLALCLGAVGLLNLPAIATAEALLLVGGSFLLRFLSRRGPGSPFAGILRSGDSTDPFERLLLWVLLATGVVLFWQIGTQLVHDYDSLGYHLPTITLWYQTGAFAVPEQIRVDYPEVERYPYNWEALCALFLFPFHEDFLVLLPNLFSWLLMGGAAFSLALRFGADRINALVSVALLLVFPIVVSNLLTLHVDLPLASLFVACLCFSSRYRETGALADLALGILSLGMLVGIKTSGLAYGGLAVFSFLVLCSIDGAFIARVIPPPWRGRLGGGKAEDSPSPSPSPRGGELLRGQSNKAAAGQSVAPKSQRPPLSLSSAFPLVVAILLFPLLGGYWYIRNLVEVGNPLGCVRVEFAGHELFPGRFGFADIHPTTLAASFDFLKWAHWKVYLGQIWEQLHGPFVILAALASLLPLPFVSRPNFASSKGLAGLFGLLAITACLYWTTPFSADNGDHQFEITSWLGGQMRFAFPFLGLLAVAAAVGSAEAKLRKGMLFSVALTGVGLGVAHIDRPQWVLFILVFFFVMRGAWRKLEDRGIRWFRFGFGEKVAGVLLLALVVVLGTSVMRLKREALRSHLFGGVARFLSDQLGEDETVGYLLSDMSYLFYGGNLDRRVLYVPARTDDLSEWLADLRRQEVDIVGVGPLLGDWKSSKEIYWLEDPDGPFIRVFGRQPLVAPLLYRFKGKGAL